MSIGEVISTLSLCASGFEDYYDHLLMVREVGSIDVNDDTIDIHFIDANTPSITVSKNGHKCLYDHIKYRKVDTGLCENCAIKTFCIVNRVYPVTDCKDYIKGD